MIQTGAKCDIAQFIEDYPSPANPEEIGYQLDCIKNALASPKEASQRPKALLKMADLLVGRNEPGDYLEASKVYDELLSSTLPADEYNVKAQIGKAELALPLSTNPTDARIAIDVCKKASAALKGRPSDFFLAKALAVEAELLLKLGGEKERQDALALYEEMISKPSTNMYFRLRGVVGVIDLLGTYYKAQLSAKYDRYIAALQEAVASLNETRPNDYFRIKGLILLSELMLLKDKDTLGEIAKKLLQDVINNEAASDDLRARASLSLAEVSSPSLAKSLLKGVRRMDGIDPYLLRRATAIEAAIKE